MSRIGLVILIWIAFVGGLALYMHHRDANVPQGTAAVELTPAQGKYTVEVTPTFSAESDPFALQAGDTGKAPALVVRLDERELLRLSDGIEAGKSIRIEDVKGLVEGANELYVEASPPTDQTDRRHFVQLRVLRDNVALDDNTFWSEGGARVAGSFRFEIKPPEEDHHGH